MVLVVLRYGVVLLPVDLLLKRKQTEQRRRRIISEILQENPKSSEKDWVLGAIGVFQQDNDPKHTSEVVKKWLNPTRIEVFERPLKVLTFNHECKWKFSDLYA